MFDIRDNRAVRKHRWMGSRGNIVDGHFKALLFSCKLNITHKNEMSISSRGSEVETERQDSISFKWNCL